MIVCTYAYCIFCCIFSIITTPVVIIQIIRTPYISVHVTDVCFICYFISNKIDVFPEISLHIYLNGFMIADTLSWRIFFGFPRYLNVILCHGQACMYEFAVPNNEKRQKNKLPYMYMQILKYTSESPSLNWYHYTSPLRWAI